ncbi:MAG TPA: zf-HC2 domain-containing protein [Mycobacteriales bacterium]|nr:zf-HC2 domain-containing protein [Mycobacteriales bacterium]
MTRPDLPGTTACSGVRTDLPGLDGHELSTRRATEVRAHLADCPDCAAEAASYRAMRRTLAELRDVPLTPPGGLLDQLLDRAASPGVVERAAVVGRGAVSGSRPRVVAAGVGLGAVAAGGLSLLAWRTVRSRRAPA